MPGIDPMSSTAMRKGPRFAPTCASSVAMAAPRASIYLKERRSRKRWCFVTRTRRASRNSSGDAFTRRSARPASLTGLVSPAISASIMARPLLPIKSVSTESNLMLASSSVFCTRSTWLDCSRTNCFRVRSRLRISWVWASGTKLARIAAAAVCADHQSFGFGMAFLSHRTPPSANRIDRKAGGVMIGAHADPSDIVGDVIDAVWNSVTQFGIDKIMNFDQFGPAFRAPLAAVVLEIAHQFLLFRINRNDRFIRRQERLGLRIDVLKLGVAIDVLVSFARLAVGLQAIAHAAQKVANDGWRDIMPLLRQLAHKVAQAAARPQQSAHRVASGGWRNQTLEIDHKGWILDCLPLAPTAPLADSPRRN